MFASEAELECELARPSQALIDAARKWSDVGVAVLGAGGKMGRGISAMARHALDAADRPDTPVIAVSRWNNDGARRSLDEIGVRTVVADLSDPLAAAELPDAAEVVFLDGLPRRVDEVKVSKGSVVNGVVMTVSGAKLRVTATVTADEAKLLKKGMSATLTSPATDPIPATVQSVELTTDQDKKTKVWTVTLDPGSPSAATAKNLAGSNVKVTVGIGSTEGEVLSVPTAALFSDSRGRTRVEVAAGSKAGQGTRFQFVKVGLTAGGDAQVTPVDGNGTTLPEGADTLTEKTQVVVGR